MSPDGTIVQSQCVALRMLAVYQRATALSGTAVAAARLHEEYRLNAVLNGIDSKGMRISSVGLLRFCA